MSVPPTFPLPTLLVRPWHDTVIDAVGHEVRSAYVERFWLGVLGPSSTLLLRRLALGLDESPEGFELDLAATATELGLGNRSGRHAPFYRSIERCCRFGAAQLIDEHTLRVRRKLPPLTRLQLARLPAAVQAAHRAWVEGPTPASRATVDVSEIRERARGLALSLLELGEDREATERQLHRWHLHPAIAHEAMAWASERLEVRRAIAPHEAPPPEAA